MLPEAVSAIKLTEIIFQQKLFALLAKPMGR
jgi:hypothetical protein